MNNTIGSIPVSQRIAIHEQKIHEASSKTENSAPKRFSEAAIKEQAGIAQKTGGVLAEHAINLQKLAQEKNTCICIRGVNPLATGLIADGFGTKDMSIKAKSSNLPPLNGLIPFDQQYGKKGGDPEEVKKFNDKNQHAIEDKVATKVPAQISPKQIKMLVEQTKNLEIRGTFLDTPGTGGLMLGKDPGIRAEPFAFWGENVNGTIHIFEAKQQGDSYIKTDNPIFVMGNLQGVAVTADYDLAMVAPRMEDIGPEHMSDLKVTSYKEFKELTGILDRMRGEVLKFIDKDDRAGLEKLIGKGETQTKLMQAFPDFDASELTKLADIAGEKEYMKGVGAALKKSELEYLEPALLQTNDGAISPDEARARLRDEMRSAVQGEVLSLLLENLGSEDKVFDIVGEPDLLAAYCDHYIEMKRAGQVEESQVSLPERPVVSRGVTSDFVNDLLGPLNQACDRKTGTEVFHHGADTGNPFSVEKDNFPMTVILPREAAGPDGKLIKIINDPKEFTAFVRVLKDAGFHTPLNALWDKDPTLVRTRSERFESARTTLTDLINKRLDIPKAPPLPEPESLDVAAKIAMFRDLQNQKV